MNYLQRPVSYLTRPTHTTSPRFEELAAFQQVCVKDDSDMAKVSQTVNPGEISMKISYPQIVSEANLQILENFTKVHKLRLVSLVGIKVGEHAFERLSSIVKHGRIEFHEYKLHQTRYLMRNYILTSNVVFHKCDFPWKFILHLSYTGYNNLALTIGDKSTTTKNLASPVLNFTKCLQNLNLPVTLKLVVVFRRHDCFTLQYLLLQQLLTNKSQNQHDFDIHIYLFAPIVNLLRKPTLQLHIPYGPTGEQCLRRQAKVRSGYIKGARLTRTAGVLCLLSPKHRC